MLEPAFHETLPEVVYRSLRDAIFNGVLKPGQPLRQDGVARSLGVSRAPLREALSRLESEGIVIQLPHRGYTVVSLDPEEIREIFDLRMLVESSAIQYSTKLRTDEDVLVATRILEEMENTSTSSISGSRHWFSLNTDFHEALLAPSRRTHHLRVISNLRGVVEHYLRIEGALTGNVEVANVEHRNLLDAFARGDVVLATELAKGHVMHTAARLISGVTTKLEAESSRAVGRPTSEESLDALGAELRTARSE